MYRLGTDNRTVLLLHSFLYVGVASTCNLADIPSVGSYVSIPVSRFVQHYWWQGSKD